MTVELVDKIKKIEEFLERKHVSTKCPQCGHDDWSYLNFGGNDGILSSEMSGGFRIYSYVCMNCANVRSHLASMIDRDFKTEKTGEPDQREQND